MWGRICAFVGCCCLTAQPTTLVVVLEREEVPDGCWFSSYPTALLNLRALLHTAQFPYVRLNLVQVEKIYPL